MNRFCNDTGVGLIPWAPLCRGHLARRPEEFGSTTRSKSEKDNQPGSHGTVEPDLTIIKRTVEIADKHEWPVCNPTVFCSLPSIRWLLPFIRTWNSDKMQSDLTCRLGLDQQARGQPHHWLQQPQALG